MQYGFLIDHRKCIGCHACTVACKAENDVPVGSFRTWVKYAERGAFPDVRRHFAVLRCNHCTNAPCVTICPVNALDKRADGIVDVDRDACIGCRACMQACPYDAIYLNEDSGAVEKCHFCAHRVERGLLPACVIVCPEDAIIPGDLHDPQSRIARMVAGNGTLVRRPDQDTGPNVHYLGAEPDILEPERAPKGASYLWSQRPARHGDKLEPWPRASVDGDGGLRTVLDADHKVEWGWPVALYLVTKGIAAGVALLAPFAGVLGLEGFAGDVLPELLALCFTGLTTALLVVDLHRPLTFLRLLTRPNTRSWLVKGAWILMAFSGVVAASLVSRLAGLMPLAEALRWPAAALALGVAGYTAFLFAQCEGRDLWQGRLLLPHLLAQAGALGAACLMPFASAGPWALETVLLLCLVGHLLLSLAEALRRHGTANARMAAAFLVRLRLWRLPAFAASLGLGVVVPAALVLAGAGASPLVPLTVLAGLLLYEWAYVRAAQLPPLS